MIAANLTLPGVSRCPARPATGHPQRVLRGWLYELLSSHTCATLETLVEGCPGFTRKEVEETIALLVAAELIDDQDRLVDLWGPTVDRACQNTVCGQVVSKFRDEPTLISQIALDLGLTEAVALAVALELEAAGRIVVEGVPGHEIAWLSDDEHDARQAVAALTRGMAPKAKKARAR